MIHGRMEKDSRKHVSRSLEGGKRKHPSTFLQRKGQGRHADTVIQDAENFCAGNLFDWQTNSIEAKEEFKWSIQPDWDKGFLDSKGERSRRKWAESKQYHCAHSSCSDVGIWADQLCCMQLRTHCRKRLQRQAQKTGCTTRKERQTLRLCETGMWSARLGGFFSIRQYTWTPVITRHGIQFYSVTMGS